jgi:exopolysaccharide biosynthesis polyprenyl glycosylphosphotransferase
MTQTIEASSAARASLLSVDVPLPVSGVDTGVVLARRSGHAGRARIGQRTAMGGLGVLLALSLLALLVPRAQSAGGALATAGAATAVWLAAFRSAFRSAYLSVGTPYAAAAGAAIGLMLFSGLTPWTRELLDVALTPWLLCEMAGASFLAAVAWHELVERMLVTKRRIMIVGTSESADALAGELARNGDTPFQVVGWVDPSRPSSTNGVHSGAVAHLRKVLREQQPDIVVVGDVDGCGQAIEPMLDFADERLRVVGLAGFFEHVFGYVPVRHLPSTWFLSLLHLRQPAHSRLAKRAFDLVGASLGLLLASPLLAILVLLVRRTGSPVFYWQWRAGQGGQPFQMVKFRTMGIDAEPDGEAVLAAEDDPRVTRVGGVLRRTHLDELPQLWNVLRGEMSLVGPRPERPELIEALERTVPFWGRRLLVKPGVTGWAQVQFGYAADVDGMAVKLSYDLWYLRHRTLALDLAICVKTVTTILGGRWGR